MGSVDMKRHVKWSSDGEYYYGRIETKLPDGLTGTVEAKLPKKWVLDAAMAMRHYIMETAPDQVNVGGWRNLNDPERFQKTCQFIANREIGKLIAQKVKTQGVVVTPWFGEWNMAVADRAYDLIMKARAGDEVSRQQLDRIREHAAAGDVRAREALRKINAVAKFVNKGMPKPSVVAQRVVVRPVVVIQNLPGQKPGSQALARRRRPQAQEEIIEEIIPDIDTVDEDPSVEMTDQDPSMVYGAGEEAEARAELDAAEASDASEEDEELPDPTEAGGGAAKAPGEKKRVARGGGGDSAVGWVASKFRSVDGQEWLWTGTKGFDDVAKAETRTLKSASGKELEMTQFQLVELVQEGELTPVAGAEVGASPVQRQRQQQLQQRSAKKQQGLRQQRRATPVSRTAPASRPGATPSATRRGPASAVKGTAMPATLSSSATPAPAAAAAARVSSKVAAMVMPSQTPMATAAAAAAQSGRIPGYLYPGDPGYPIYPGQPGYGVPVPANTPYGLQGAMMQGGGGGGGSFPDEGGGGGGGGGDGWGGDDGDLEDDLPHDDKGEVQFPEDDDQGVPGAQYPEEKAQSVGGVDAGGSYNDNEDDGPVSFPDEGQQAG